MKTLTLTDEHISRFWTHVEKTDSCWLWQGHTDKDGYGVMRVGGRMAARTHRIAWVVENGPIHADLYVLHHCDNPPCVRHDHLFLGTALANAADRDRKGRGVALHGSDLPQAKLSDALIEAIADEYVPGQVSQRELAQKYNVSQAQIGHVVRGVHWKHIPRSLSTNNHSKAVKRGTSHPAAKLTEDDVRAIRRRYTEGGISQQKLATEYGVGQTLISAVILRQVWKEC